MALERLVSEDSPGIWTLGTHIVFRNMGKYFNGKEHKTNLYHVTAKADNFMLGVVLWFPRWRKYCFHPDPNTVFEETCLQDITEFITQETRAHRALKKASS